MYNSRLNEWLRKCKRGGRTAKGRKHRSPHSRRHVSTAKRLGRETSIHIPANYQNVLMRGTRGRQCGAVSLGVGGTIQNNPTFLFQPSEITRFGHRKIAVPIVEKNPNECRVEI